MQQHERGTRGRSRFVPAALMVAAAVALPVFNLAAGPELSATFTATGAQPSGDSVHLTFSFSLRAAQPSELVVEAVKLGRPSAADHPYATFQGGTIPPGGELKGSDSVTVPKTIYKKWKSGEPAALFVKTHGESGSSVWTRVDAVAAGAIH